MRWNITRERENFQQSSFIVSNTARRSYNSLCAAQTEIGTSMLLDSDISRIIPDNGIHYAMSPEKRFPDHQFSGPRTPSRLDRSIDIHHSSPLSPLSRHVIEELCSSDTETRVSPQFAKNPPLSILPTQCKDDVASENFGTGTASQALQGHSCFRGCGCSPFDIEGGQTPRSPAQLPPKLVPEMGQVVNRIRRLSTTPQSHRFVSCHSIRFQVLIHISGAP